MPSRFYLARGESNAVRTNTGDKIAGATGRT